MAECAVGDTGVRDNRKSRFVLVVDSNPAERNYTSIILQRFEYSVCTAATAEEALESMAVAVPALVIADAALQGKSGLELLGSMRQREGLKDIPLIFLSSFTDPGMEEQCHFAGCADYLRKPVTAQELYRAVQLVLEPVPRKSIRIAAYVKADIGGSPAGIAEYASVISENGMFVRTTATRPVGTVLPVGLMIRGRTLRIAAQVIYSYGFGEYPYKEPGMGLKFESITPADRAVIGDFIIEQVVAGLADPGKKE